MISWLTLPITELSFFYVIVIVKKYVNLLKPSAVDHRRCAL
jgi:hypothetical protein